MYSIHSGYLPQCRLPDLGQSLWGSKGEGKRQRDGRGKVDWGGGGGREREGQMEQGKCM